MSYLSCLRLKFSEYKHESETLTKYMQLSPLWLTMRSYNMGIFVIVIVICSSSPNKHQVEKFQKDMKKALLEGEQMIK